MFFVIPASERVKPRFEAYVDGALFTMSGELALNEFVQGRKVNINDHKPAYKIITNSNSEIGVVKDRLVAQVHSSPILIVSEKFKKFFETNYPNDAQFFPVLVEAVNEQTLENYFICNVLNKIDCTDYENSDFSYHFDGETPEENGGIYTIDSLVIDPNTIPKNRHFFLLGNINVPVFIISEKLKDQLTKEGYQGFKFVQPEEFTM